MTNEDNRLLSPPSDAVDCERLLRCALSVQTHPVGTAGRQKSGQTDGWTASGGNPGSEETNQEDQIHTLYILYIIDHNPRFSLGSQTTLEMTPELRVFTHLNGDGKRLHLLKHSF